MLFVPLGILMVVALGRRLTWLAVLAGLGLGALVEFWSARAAGEPLSWLDLLLNAVGAVVGVGDRLRGARRVATGPTEGRCTHE